MDKNMSTLYNPINVKRIAKNYTFSENLSQYVRKYHPFVVLVTAFLFERKTICEINVMSDNRLGKIWFNVKKKDLTYSDRF